MLQRNIDVVERLAKDLRELARAEVGKLSLQKTSIDLAELVKAAVETYNPLATQEGVHLRLEGTAALVVEADQDRIYQVVVNLLRNAIKFTPKGGTITVSIEGKGREVVVRVADTGTGIEPAAIPRLFQPFAQIQQAETNRDRGSGLGLCISKCFIEAHDGRIWVQSAGKGKGSTFSFSLPLPRT